MARQIEDEAASLRREQARISALKASIEEAGRQLGQAQAAQAAEAAALDAQIAAARGQERAAEDAASVAARRGAEAASRAETLRAAIARIEAERRDAEARAQADAALATHERRDADAERARQREAAIARPAGPGIVGAASGGDTAAAPTPQLVAGAGSAPGGAGVRAAVIGTRLTAPVAGRVVRGFGEASDAGPASGLSYETPPSARVVSPCGGRVVFAGPFRSFGQLAIVDCGAGDMFVLAGLARLDARVGALVQPGEPVGVMPDWDPRAGGPRPSLYVELRHGGEPVNPAPFLRAKG
jgi:septal ring factor EnvC (AmiA/AmiB activator)